MTRIETETPAARIRRALEEARDLGIDFDSAWGAAVGPALVGIPPRPRIQWQRALAWSESEWRRAYNGEPPTGVGVALDQLAGRVD